MTRPELGEPSLPVVWRSAPHIIYTTTRGLTFCCEPGVHLNWRLFTWWLLALGRDVP